MADELNMPQNMKSSKATQHELAAIWNACKPNFKVLRFEYDNQRGTFKNCGK